MSKQETYRGVKLKFPEPYRLEHEEAEWSADDVPGDGVLIRTETSLISPGTELALYTGTHIDLHNPANRWAKLPFYPGYASVGEAVAVGRDVRGLRAGQRVLAMGHHATYDIVAAGEASVVPLPDEADPKLAAFAWLAEIATAATVQARFVPGDWVAVIGMGLIGNLAAQLFALQGARVVGVDVVERRLEIAREAGIPLTVRPTSDSAEELISRVSSLTGGDAPRVVVEATGNPGLVSPALQLVRRLGQVILLGSPRGTAEVDLYRHIHTRGVSLVGAHNHVKGTDGLPTSADMLRYVLELIVRRQLAIEPLITHELPAAEAARAYDMLLGQKEQALGVLLDWS